MYNSTLKIKYVKTIIISVSLKALTCSLNFTLNADGKKLVDSKWSASLNLIFLYRFIDVPIEKVASYYSFADN